MLMARGIFDKHIAFFKAQGLESVRERAKKSKVFFYDPECGPWSAAIANDDAFADAFGRQDLSRYLALVETSRDSLFHNTMPSGVSGDQLMAINIPTFIMSGTDAAHPLSTSHTLAELIPKAKLSSILPLQQNAQSVGQWIRESAKNQE